MRNLLASRFVTSFLIGILIAAAPSPARGEQGTRTDGRTGLTWVADLDFAVHTGFTPEVVTTRVQALRLVAAMNRGEIENFGRRDWRIPTAGEVATRLRRIRAPQAVGASSPVRAWVAAGAGANAWQDLVVAWPVAASATLAGVPAAAVIATNSVLLAKDMTVTGNVVANQAATGPTLKAGFELAVEKNTHIAGAIAADSIKIDKDVTVSSDASYNTLQNQGSIVGPLHTPLALPVFGLLPTFETAAPHPAAPNVTVAAGQTVTLAAGHYGAIDVAAQGNLVLSGGTYDVRSVHLGGNCGFPCARLQFAGPTDLRVAERVDAGPFSRIGPLAASGVGAADVVVYIGGINGTTGALTATPPPFQVGKNCVVEANVYAPNGSLLVDKDSTVVGSLIARDIQIDKNTTVTVASYFGNRAPVAHPQTVLTSGATPVVITLTGTDPENEDLTFAIVTGPTQGALGAVVPVEPPVDPDPRPGAGPPPHTAATVTYTPATAGNLTDSFTFQVEDPHGAIGVATVTINPPPEGGGDPTPPTTVVVTDFSETTVQDRAVTLTLSGDAPAGVELTFSIAAGTGPDSGVLSPLVQGSESPRRSATTVYTPNTGFLGSDAFDFTACGIISSVTVCATATASIEVVTATPEPTDLAPDLETETSETQPLEITLGSPGATSGASVVAAPAGIVVIARPAAVQVGADIAGNVADAEPNGFGDNHNALPGPAPVFVSAGVGLSGGGGSNGTARIHMEWDVSSFGGNLQSATVTLETHRGTIDSLDTFFFAGAGGNGTLENTDFESSLEAVGAVMPVPPLAQQPVGADGTFTFDVLPELQAALNAGADFFTVQGRVNETTAGSFRGLEVYSTASGNIATFRHPQLAIATPGVTPSIAFTILALPAHGVLRDSLGDPVTAVPALLPSSRVTYTANASFVGDDSFGYEAALGAQIDTGVVFVRVRAGSCATDPLFCDPGR